MPSLLDPDLAEELSALARRYRLRSLTPLAGNSRVEVQNAASTLISFSSNDYLGLACHPAVAEAANAVALASGFGAGASRLITGTFPEHLELESALASLVGAEAAILFPTGYQANLGMLAALAGPDDLLVADRAIHASLIDGCRLSRAKLALYPHLDLDRACQHLARLGPSARRRFLLTESLFSMDGDIAPLADLARLAADHHASLIVDEAHAVGAQGPHGAGLCAETRVRPDALIGTLGKALGTAGAFVAGSRILCNYLLNTARTFLFTTATPPSLAAAALAAVRVSRSPAGDTLRSNLASNAARLRSRLRLPPVSSVGPIIPIVLGRDDAVLAASAHLRARGFLVAPIRPPTVREGTARLRLTVSALHTPEQIDALSATISDLPGRIRPSSTARSAPLSRSPPPSPVLHRVPGLVILGTDTGVGKTTVTAALLRLLFRRGHRPVPFKPVETGCNPAPADALRLLEASCHAAIQLATVCPFPLPLPVAPAAADQRGISLTPILVAAAAAAAHGSPLLVETAGGALTPYSPGLTSADLAAALGFPVLLVARNALGTVNHTALATAELRRRGLPLAGILLVNTSPTPSPDQATNSALIEQLTSLRPLGTLPFLPQTSTDAAADALSAAVDLVALFDELT